MNPNAILTDCEYDVARLIAWGAAKKEISDRLSISEATVRKHSEHIYRKLGVQKATEVSVWWFCSHCGVSWRLDPMKRVLGVVLVMVVMCHDVLTLDNSLTRFRIRRTAQTEWVARKES